MENISVKSKIETLKQNNDPENELSDYSEDHEEDLVDKKDEPHDEEKRQRLNDLSEDLELEHLVDKKEDLHNVENENSKEKSETEGGGLAISLRVFLTLLSFVDVITDILLGINLSSSENKDQDIETKNYGYLVLVVCWFPGIVSVIHMIAHHRVDYWEKKTKFFLGLLLLLIVYPLVTPFSLLVTLWNFNTPEDKKNKKMLKFCFLTELIEGSIEAPIQMTITLFLIMKGLLNLPWSSGEVYSTIDLSYNKIPAYGLPVISFILSSLSILKSAMVINVLNVYEGGHLGNQIGGHFPFYFHAICFRVLAFAFTVVYLNEIACIPFLLILIANVLIWYKIPNKIDFPTELQEHLRDKSRKQEPESEMVKINHPSWLNIFLSVLVPSCYLDIIEQKSVLETKDSYLTEKVFTYYKSYQRKIIRYQVIISTLIIMVTVLLIWILVNFTSYNYNPNIFSNLDFNVFCVVLLILGILTFIFLKDVDIYYFRRMNKSTRNLENKWINWIIVGVKVLVTFTLVLIILSPLVGGYIYCEYYSPKSTFLVFNEFGENYMNITAIKTRPYNIPSNMSKQQGVWGPVVRCNYNNCPDLFSCEKARYFSGTNLVIDMADYDKRCYKTIIEASHQQMDCLAFQSIIILEEENFIFSSSQRVKISAPEYLPVLFINDKDRVKANFNKVLADRSIVTLTSNVTLCNIMNLETILKLGKTKCLKPSIKQGDFISLGGCDFELDRKMIANCLSKGQPCNEYQYWFENEKKYDLTACEKSPDYPSEAVVISGGATGNDAETSLTMEVFYPFSDFRFCTLPSHPARRSSHTMDGWTICGGYNKDKNAHNCITLQEDRRWTASETVDLRGHISVPMDGGILLMFDRTYSNTKTTFVGNDGSVTAGPIDTFGKQ